jgi:MOSC domain-containing protein YiiM
LHRTTAELEQLLDGILAAPSDEGSLEMIVIRPAEGERRLVDSADLDLTSGLVGDNWLERGSGTAENQLTLMNVRATDAVAVSRDRWQLAGDQLLVDFDLSVANLPPGARVAIGDAIVEMSSMPHTGCAKFSGRFGAEALRFVNVGVGRENRLRGANAFVVVPGRIAVGDVVRKL